jgi:amino acid transporter
MAEVESGAPDYEGGGLSRETNWWGAFVIGLAGTILVTGIAPVMVTSLGASAIPLMIAVTLSGYLLCLFLAELSAMMPERAGGSPTYAYVAYKDKWPRFAEHVNGFTCWAYWLGWFPVGPLNMILASYYIASLFGLNLTSGFTPIHTFIAYWTIGIAIAGIMIVFIPAWLGIRLGALFATVLGVISMIPLTFLAVAPIFVPSKTDWGQLTSPSLFSQIDGTAFFTNLYGHGWLTIYIAFCFLLTWNVIAMEAAACYIGECKDPKRDAKIAMNLEGLYGVFIYTMIPISFIVVIGIPQINSYVTSVGGLVDANQLFVTFANTLFGSSANWLDNLIAIMLITALSLSVLNAVMGSARGLHQMAIDGQFPRIFHKVNRHGVPGWSMGFNVVCMIALNFTGGAVEIYTLSNVGYTISFVPVLVGYFLLRRNRPDMQRPVRLPEFFKYLALALAAAFFVIWLYGGIVESSLPNAFLNNNDTRIYFVIGWIILLSYLPLYWYRKRVEDPRHADEAGGTAPAAAAGD